MTSYTITNAGRNAELEIAGLAMNNADLFIRLGSSAFPAKTIIAGNPAKIIRENVNWHRNERMSFDEFSKLEG